MSRNVRRSRAHEKALALRGKLDLDVDLEESRDRRSGGDLDSD